jgi:hypothetical protein
MQYSPKLKKAADEISAILEKYDIAAAVTLHTPCFAEYLLRLNPSYSCVKPENGSYRIKSQLEEDHGGNKEEQTRVLTDTSNMLSLLSNSTGNLALNIMEMSEKIDKAVGAEHGDLSSSSHTEQNN